MYIIKNAFRCIGRSKGRNILTDQGKCVILVRHSPEVAAMCDECYELHKISRKSK